MKVLTRSPARNFRAGHDAMALMGVFLRELQRSPALCVTVIGTAIGPTAAALGLDLLLHGNGTLLTASTPTLTAIIGVIVPMSLLALPLVRLRDQGTLRLIATTPARQSSAMLAGIAIAALGAGAAMILLLGALATFSAIGPLAVGGTLTSLVFGVGVASLIGALVRHPATARALSIVAPAAAVLASGALPWARIFPAISPVVDLLPTAVISDAVATGSTSAHPPVALLMVAIVGVAICLIGVRWCRA